MRRVAQNKIIFFLFPAIFIFLCFPRVYCAEENFNITTYYPSPYGSYGDCLIFNRMAIGNVNISADGRVDAGDMAVFGSNDTGAPGTEILGSLTIASRLGIGTTTPNNLLQVKDLITFSNTTANTRETLLGFNAGHAGVSTSRIENTFIGHQAGQNNLSGVDNTAIGINALQNNTTGSNNTAAGENTIQSDINTGASNTALGRLSLQLNSTGSNNTAMGGALKGNTSGVNNTAIGWYALYAHSNNTDNTAIGWGAIMAGQNNNNSRNIAIGTNAGSMGSGSTLSGSRYIAIGNSVGSALSAAAVNSYLNIGNLIYGMNLNQSYVTSSIGVIPDANFKLKVAGKINATDAIHATKFCFGEGTVPGSCISGGWPSGSPSDAALKKDVLPLGDNTLVKLNHLSGVTFEWKDAKDYSSGRQIGLIAQEVEKYYPELVGKDSRGYRTLSYDKFTAVLLEGIKELRSRNQALKKRLALLEEQILG